MNRFLPSKKLMVFLGVVLLILFGFLLFSKYQDRKIIYRPTQNTENKTLNEISRKIIQNDSDGDGLKDWEETLWKTDPHNPDTDGDGTNDNDEILANRNPLIPGPGDLMKIAVASNKQNNEIQYDQTLTQTDILARELFSGYLLLKQNDQLGGEQQQQFIETLAEKHIASNPSKQYTSSDLIIIQSDGKDIIQQYADELTEIMNSNAGSGHDVIIAKNAVERNDKKELEKIGTNIILYKDMREQFLILETPAVLAQIHLGIINGISALIGDASKLKLIFEDPIVGLASAKNYMDNEIILVGKFAELGKFFKEHNIKF